MSTPTREELLVDLVAESHRLAARLLVSHQARADALGLGATDLLCLELIGAEQPATAGRLAEVMQLTTGAITGVLDRLEGSGLVRRERDPDDRRRVLVRLAPERERELADLLDPLAAALADVTEGRSDADVRAARDFVARLHPAVAAESARLSPSVRAAATAATGPSPVSLPRGGARRMRLEVSAGLVDVTLRGDPDLPDLVRAAFGGRAPALERSGDTVTVRLKAWSLFRGWTGSGTLTLNAAVRWDVALRGGMAQLTADLSRLDLASLEIGGGMSQVRVSLPEPRGTVPVAMRGGASALSVDRPAGTPVRIHVASGASSLRLDAAEFQSVGETRWQTPDYDAATDRFDITLRGGADHLELTTR